LRRPLRIPNPFSYSRVAELIVTHWQEIRDHTWKVRISATRPQVLKSSPRCITPRYRYSEVPRLRALRRRGARYLLKVDVNQFYPNIYTHAIPWALDGKDVAKANLAAKNPATTGDRFDKALRSMNDGQTLGVPIGPDASLVASEVILAAVDAELSASCRGVFRGFRYVDDYELACSTLRHAEEVLVKLQSILAKYELQPNPRKTEIVELPCALDGPWAHELASFIISPSSTPVRQRNDLIALFSRAFDIASEDPEKSVLRYAVSRIQNIDVSPKGWRVFQNCLLGVATADPATLPTVYGTLFRVADASRHAVERSPLASILNPIIATHAPLAHGSEVAWALWGAIAWDASLDPSLAPLISQMDDDVVALLAIEAQNKGLLPVAALDLQRWTTFCAQPDVLRSEHWLLAYEAHLKGWLNTPSLPADPLFSNLLDAGVSFMDLTRNIPQYPAASNPIPGSTLDDDYA
jgi:hypothetical protein